MSRIRDIANLFSASTDMATDAEVTSSIASHAAAADPHTGYVLESLYDAKGDLIVGSADNTPSKLTSGNNGETLVADSSTATGLKWAAPASGLSAASQAEMEAASSTTVAVTPGRQQFHPSAAKFWVYYTGTGTPTIQASYAVTSLVDNGVGAYTVNLTTAFSSGSYALAGGVDKLSGASSATTLTGTCFSGAYNTNSFLQQTYDLNGTLVDSARVFAVGYGDQ